MRLRLFLLALFLIRPSDGPAYTYESGTETSYQDYYPALWEESAAPDGPWERQFNFGVDSNRRQIRRGQLLGIALLMLPQFRTLPPFFKRGLAVSIDENTRVRPNFRRIRGTGRTTLGVELRLNF